MNSIKSKTESVRRKKRTTAQSISAHSRNATTKKTNGTVRNKVQHASTEEFSLLKDISGYNNENLRITNAP